MSYDDFRLSVEELALAMSTEGRAEIAQSMMVAQLGKMEQEEARLRLLTAGHSLLARGWLTLEADGTLHLVDSMARVARVLSGADFSIRYSRSYPTADFSLAFHFGEGCILGHRIEQGVVHHISEVGDNDSVIQEGVGFFDVVNTAAFASPPFEISKELLELIKDDPAPVVIDLRLSRAGVPDEARAMLTEDLSQVRYRGSVLRVEYNENKAPVSDRGLLILCGPQRLWLLRPFLRENRQYVTFLPGTEQSFREEVAALL